LGKARHNLDRNNGENQKTFKAELPCL